MPFEQLIDRLPFHITQLAYEFFCYEVQQILEMKSDRPYKMYRIVFIPLEAKHIVTEKVLEALINQGLYIVPVRRQGEYLGKACHIDIGMRLVVHGFVNDSFVEAVLVEHHVIGSFGKFLVEECGQKPATEICATGFIAKDISKATCDAGVNILSVKQAGIGACTEDAADTLAAIISSEGSGL